MPETYIRNFVNSAGYVFLYDKWATKPAFPSKPKDSLRSKHLYRQPVHAEVRFSNRIEHFFDQEVESHWPRIIAKLKQHDEIGLDDWDVIVRFVSAQFVRVPLILDAVVEVLRHHVLRASDNIKLEPEIEKFYARKLNRQPDSMRDLVSNGLITISIDPHRALIAMPYLIKSIPIFQPGVPLGVPKIIHNETDLPFITSDSPAVFYSEKSREDRIIPYEILPGRPIALIFPLTSRMALVSKDFFPKKRQTHLKVSDRNLVGRINRMVSRFAYRFVVSEKKDVSESYGKKFASICPRPRSEMALIENEIVRYIPFEFGEPRPVNNTWSYDFAG